MRFSVVAAVDRFHFDRRKGRAMPSRNSPKVMLGSGAIALRAFTSFKSSSPPGSVQHRNRVWARFNLPLRLHIRPGGEEKHYRRGGAAGHANAFGMRSMSIDTVSKSS